jgi:type VI secretion system secreted protein Hcp
MYWSDYSLGVSMPIYMKIDSINGEVTAAGYEKWIDVSSLQFGIGRAISTPVGGGSKRESGHPSISEITLSKQFDTASIDLFSWSTAGASKLVKIDMVQTGDKDKVSAYLHFELTNTLISGYSMSSGGDKPSESLSLNFTKITEKYIPYDSDNKAGQPIVKGYDLTTAKTV